MIWLEVHVDDLALMAAPAAEAPGRWADTAALLDGLARDAENAGARLSFRLREAFARGDRTGFVAGLVARGHEVGWHAHGSRLRAARDAVVAAGGSAAIAAPGLVQSGERGRLALLEEARALGAIRVTDRVEARVFAYQGWLAWEPLPGLVALDVSVSPFVWGVLQRRGRDVGPGTLDPDALLACLAAQERRVPPPGATAFFGATFHEHNVLRPADRAAVRRLLATLGPRVVPSGSLPYTRPPAAPVARLHPLAPVVRLGLAVERRLARAEIRSIQAGSRRIAARRAGPARARAALVLVHGGGGGIAQGLGFCGLRDADLAADGIAVWSFDRSDSFRTPGNPVHLADTRAVLAAALAENVPTAVMSWSAGLIPGLRAALDTPQVTTYFDAEGPVDRFSLLPPGRPGHELAEVDTWDDAAWAGREMVDRIRAFPGTYVRLQAERDHVHGPMAWHAARMVAAARNGRLNGDGTLLPGRLDAHGPAIRDWIRGALLAPAAPAAPTAPTAPTAPAG